MFTINNILTFDNLYNSMLKCQKGVYWKPSVAHFILNAPEEIYKLTRDLQEETYKEKKHKKFTIYEPKEREVLSIQFRDRVYQRTLNDLIVYPIMTKSFIQANCACQKDKGTDFARNLMKRYLRSYFNSNNKSNDGYIIHIDIKHYYPSMDHNICEKLFEDNLPKSIMPLIHNILKVYDGETGYNPGSQLIQILGVSLLNKLDHYIKEKLRVKYYIRYMDDLILIVKDNCLFYLNEIEKQLSTLKLSLNKEKTKICKLNKGNMFLGFKFSLGKTGKIYQVINNQNVKRRRKKLLKTHTHQTFKLFDESYKTWYSYANKSTSKNSINKINLLYNNIKENYYGIKN